MINDLSVDDPDVDPMVAFGLCHQQHKSIIGDESSAKSHFGLVSRFPGRIKSGLGRSNGTH